MGPISGGFSFPLFVLRACCFLSRLSDLKQDGMEGPGENGSEASGRMLRGMFGLRGEGEGVRQAPECWDHPPLCWVSRHLTLCPFGSSLRSGLCCCHVMKAVTRTEGTLQRCFPPLRPRRAQTSVWTPEVGSTIAQAKGFKHSKHATICILFGVHLDLQRAQKKGPISQNRENMQHRVYDCRYFRAPAQTPGRIQKVDPPILSAFWIRPGVWPADRVGIWPDRSSEALTAGKFPIRSSPNTCLALSIPELSIPELGGAKRGDRP